MPVKQADTDSLASFLLRSNRQPGARQAYTNIAWSLAVIGHLHQAQFTLMLDQMLALSLNPTDKSTPSLVPTIQLTQLYQALDWLQSHPTAPAQQQSAWSSLQGKLYRLGPRPAPTKPPSFGIPKLCAALRQLQLSFKAMIVQSYWVPPLLQPRDSKARPVILRLFSPDYINNNPGRSCTTLTDCITLLSIVSASCSICISLSTNCRLILPALAFVCILNQGIYSCLSIPTATCRACLSMKATRNGTSFLGAVCRAFIL